MPPRNVSHEVPRLARWKSASHQKSRPVQAIAARWLLGCALLFAGCAKIAMPSTSGILSPTLSSLVAVAEIGASQCLFFNVYIVHIALLGSVLSAVGIFIGMLVKSPCGCLGGLDLERKWHIVYSSLTGLVAYYLLYSAHAQSAWQRHEPADSQ
jgi:hypothetical protein